MEAGAANKMDQSGCRKQLQQQGQLMHKALQAPTGPQNLVYGMIFPSICFDLYSAISKLLSLMCKMMIGPQSSQQSAMVDPIH